MLFVGALCDLLSATWTEGTVADSALIAHKLFRYHKEDLLSGVSRSRNARRLLAHPELKEDVSFCVQRDVLTTVPEMNTNGCVTREDY